MQEEGRDGNSRERRHLLSGSNNRLGGDTCGRNSTSREVRAAGWAAKVEMGE